MHLSSGHLTELTAGRTAASAKDRIRVEGSPEDDQAIAVQTGASRRRFDIHHLRQDASKAWRSVKVQNALVTDDQLRVHAPVAFDAVEISGTTARRDVDVQLRRHDGSKVATRNLSQQRVPAGRALRMAPADWERLSRSSVSQMLA